MGDRRDRPAVDGHRTRCRYLHRNRDDRNVLTLTNSADSTIIAYATLPTEGKTFRFANPAGTTLRKSFQQDAKTTDLTLSKGATSTAVSIAQWLDSVPNPGWTYTIDQLMLNGEMGAVQMTDDTPTTDTFEFRMLGSGAHFNVNQNAADQYQAGQHCPRQAPDVTTERADNVTETALDSGAKTLHKSNASDTHLSLDSNVATPATHPVGADAALLDTVDEMKEERAATDFVYRGSAKMAQYGTIVVPRTGMHSANGRLFDHHDLGTECISVAAGATLARKDNSTATFTVSESLPAGTNNFTLDSIDDSAGTITFNTNNTVTNPMIVSDESTMLELANQSRCTTKAATVKATKLVVSAGISAYKARSGRDRSSDRC